VTARRRTLAIVCMLAALAAGARAATAQPTTWPERLSGAARATLDAVADSARRAGLPTSPLYAKAAEGVLKGADDARIVQALRTLVGELGAARDALGAGASHAEMVAGASALHAGVPPAAVRRLALARAAAGGAHPLATPLVVLADLVTRRVPPAAAASAVDALVRRGAADRDFAALRAGVERDILAGQPPLEAAQARARLFVEKDRTRPPEVGPPE